MAKKKGKASGKKAKAAGGKRRSGGGRGQSPLNMLQQVFAGMSDKERLSLLETISGMPVDESLLMPQVSPSGRRANKVSRLIDEARNQPSARQAVPVLNDAVGVARTALGRRMEKYQGRLGDLAAGLDYLEAKFELVQALRYCGQDADALAHAEEVYCLDPGDPCRIRPLLLDGYLDAGRNDDAARLLAKDAAEPWAAWLFGRVLLALRRGERGPAAEQFLKLAHEHNPHVLSLLLGERVPDPRDLLDIEVGEDSEAQEYACEFLPAWKDTPGAIAWLRAAAARLNLDSPNDDAPLPEPIDPARIAALAPHEHERWVVGWHESPPIAALGGESSGPTSILFAFTLEGDEIDFDACAAEPAAGDLWRFLADAMLDAQPPGRPRQLLVYPPSIAPLLVELCGPAGIEAAAYDQGETLTAMFDQIALRIKGGQEAARALPAGALGELPFGRDEVWEAAITQLPRRLTIGGQSVRPWVVLVMSSECCGVLWHELLLEFPAAGTLAAAVRMAMASPMLGTPRRPRRVLVRELDDLVALRGLAGEAEFTCQVAPELSAIQDAVVHLTSELLGGEHPVILSRIEGIDAADLERFYTRAAEYYRAQPWRHFGMDEVLALESIEPAARPWYGLVMGQSGVVRGLALYEQMNKLKQAFFAQSPEENAAATEGFSLLFGEEAEVAPDDLDAIEQFGWPVATPEAYPTALRIRPGPRIERPDAAELRRITAGLEAVVRLTQSSERHATAAIAGITLRVTRLGTVPRDGA